MNKKVTADHSVFHRWMKGVSYRLANALGHLPQRGEIAKLGGFRFRILRADSRCIHLLSTRLKKENVVGGA